MQEFETYDFRKFTPSIVTVYAFCPVELQIRVPHASTKLVTMFLVDLATFLDIIWDTVPYDAPCGEQNIMVLSSLTRGT